MRVIEAFNEPVEAVAVSPDGRFLAAATDLQRCVWHWESGTVACWVNGQNGAGQLVFTPDGNWLLFLANRRIERLSPITGDQVPLRSGVCAGAVAVSPDGKELVAPLAGYPQEVQLQRWLLPGWREVDGIDYWSPFKRIAFSPNGEYIAGISLIAFELRFAHSFGLNRRERSPDIIWHAEQERLDRQRRFAYQLRPWQDAAPPEIPSEPAYLTFPRDSETVVFGWGPEFRVMETRAGSVLKRVKTPGPPFRDATFVGSGRQLVTVDGTEVVRLWSTDTWEVQREYDWSAGRLTCLAVTADGLAAVCGTESGRLVIFDVDE